MARKNDESLPNKQVIINLLNQIDYENSLAKILDHYETYINYAASEPVYSEYGEYVGQRICEDLKQEIHLKLIQSIYVLRRKMMDNLDLTD